MVGLLLVSLVALSRVAISAQSPLDPHRRRRGSDGGGRLLRGLHRGRRVGLAHLREDAVGGVDAVASTEGVELSLVGGEWWVVSGGW